jgi:hypothetical protein
MTLRNLSHSRRFRATIRQAKTGLMAKPISHGREIWLASQTERRDITIAGGKMACVYAETV